MIISALSVGIDLGSLPLTSPLKPTKQHGSTPYAITNPIWIDVNGDGWTPPKPPLTQRATPTGAPPDVRARFDEIQDLATPAARGAR